MSGFVICAFGFGGCGGCWEWWVRRIVAATGK
jgi:hypothetical protein